MTIISAPRPAQPGQSWRPSLRGRLVAAAPTAVAPLLVDGSAFVTAIKGQF